MALSVKRTRSCSDSAEYFSASSLPVDNPWVSTRRTTKLGHMDTDYVPFSDLPWATEDDVRENWDLLVSLTAEFHVTNLRYASSNRIIVTCPDNGQVALPFHFAAAASQAIHKQLRIYTDEVLANERVSQDLLHARALA